jgi:DNA-binding IclR family transcriptional regulator
LRTNLRSIDPNGIVPRSAACKAAERLFVETRADGLGRVRGGLSPGVNAISVLIFDNSNSLVGVLSSLGPADFFDDSPSAPLAAQMKHFAMQISQDFGHMPDSARAKLA